MIGQGRWVQTTAPPCEIILEWPKFRELVCQGRDSREIGAAATLPIPEILVKVGFCMFAAKGLLVEVERM